jgi:hypothetical protein
MAKRPRSSKPTYVVTRPVSRLETFPSPTKDIFTVEFTTEEFTCLSFDGSTRFCSFDHSLSAENEMS